MTIGLRGIQLIELLVCIQLWRICVFDPMELWPPVGTGVPTGSKQQHRLNKQFLVSLSESRVGYGLDDGGSTVRFLAEAMKRYFSLHHRFQTGSEVHPDSFPVGTEGSFPGIKRPARQPDHSPSSNVAVKNEWSYTSTPQYVFIARCLVKHKDNFTFY